MENNLVRTEELLGSKKNIIGNGKSDLILETLGKIYIKSGKLTRILNDVFKLLDGINANNVGSKTIITKSLASIKYPGDGYLVFDTSENALYISYDLRYLLVIDGIDKEVIDAGFVKKKGDSMTGQLRILHNGAPLIVASNDLVKNFNANYLEGHNSKYFAAKSLDEIITGYWTFKNNTLFEDNVEIINNATIRNNAAISRDAWVGLDLVVDGNEKVGKTFKVIGTSEFKDIALFRDNVTVEGDIVTSGSIGSPMFMSGYQGYGWRFDANTNMLTVDYLVVRKAMHVFELVVNKVSATNGSLWVTDSAKIEKVFDVKTLPIYKKYIDENKTEQFVKDEDRLNGIDTDTWYLPYYVGHNRVKLTLYDSYIKRPEEYTVTNGLISLGTTSYDIFKYICKYKSEDLRTELDSNNGQVVLDESGNKKINSYADDTSNMDKIALLFPESDIMPDSNPPTHFLRQTGFGFPLLHETPLYRHEYTPQYRLAITETAEADIKYVYDTTTEQYREALDGEIPKYAEKTFNMYVLASSSETPTHRYNTVTKLYIECDDYRAKYIKKDVTVYILGGPGEEATHIRLEDQETREAVFISKIPTHKQSIGYVPATENATHVVIYRDPVEGEIPTHISYCINAEYVKDVSTNEFRKAEEGEEATHVLYDGVYTETDQLCVGRAVMDDEIPNAVREYVEAEEGATHKAAIVYEQAVFLNYSEDNEVKYVFNPLTSDFVDVTSLTATYVLSNYIFADGLNSATHVFVPEEYYAPASNVYVPTHLQDDKGLWLTREEYCAKNPSIDTNILLNPQYTPKVITLDRKLETFELGDIKYLAAFYRYFGIPANDDIWDNASIVNLDNVKVILMKDDEYPPFKEGDIVRCLKFEDGNIKYYDAIIASKIDTYSYIIIVAGSVFDKQTTVEYNEDGTIKEYKEELNKTQYSKTSQLSSNGNYVESGNTALDEDGFDENELISGPAPEDGLVRIGHLYDRDRQNSVYITSSEMDSPYIQTISGVNRPDYSVLYAEPDFITNDRGYYQFTVEGIKVINRNDWGDDRITATVTTVITPKGNETFPLTTLTNLDGVTVGTFYAPNNQYIVTMLNDSMQYVIADYNNKVKQNTNVRARLGNLNGITDSMFAKKQPYGYGLFSDNVFLKGEFYLNNGQTVVEFAKDYINMSVSQADISLVNAFKNVVKTENSPYGWYLGKQHSLDSITQTDLGVDIICGNEAGYGSYLVINESVGQTILDFFEESTLKITIDSLELTAHLGLTNPKIDIYVGITDKCTVDDRSKVLVKIEDITEPGDYEGLVNSIYSSLKETSSKVFLIILAYRCIAKMSISNISFTYPLGQAMSALSVTLNSINAAIAGVQDKMATTALTANQAKTAVETLLGDVSTFQQTANKISASVGLNDMFRRVNEWTKIGELVDGDGYRKEKYDYYYKPDPTSGEVILYKQSYTNHALENGIILPYQIETYSEHNATGIMYLAIVDPDIDSGIQFTKISNECEINSPGTLYDGYFTIDVEEALTEQPIYLFVEFYSPIEDNTDMVVNIANEQVLETNIGTYAALTITNDKIESTVSNFEDGYKSYFTQEADKISLQVLGFDGRVSIIETDLDGITTRVGNAEGQLSAIEQTAKNISLSVFENTETLIKHPNITTYTNSNTPFDTSKLHPIDDFKYYDLPLFYINKNYPAYIQYDSKNNPSILIDNKTDNEINALVRFRVFIDNDVKKENEFYAKIPCTLDEDTSMRFLYLNGETWRGCGTLSGKTTVDNVTNLTFIASKDLNPETVCSLMVQVTVSPNSTNSFPCNIEMVYDGYSADLKRTGIDISNGLIKFKANNTEFDPDGFVFFGGDNGAIFYKNYLLSLKGVDSDGNYVTCSLGDVFDALGLSGDVIPALFIDFYDGTLKTNKLSETYLEFKHGEAAMEIKQNESYNVKTESGLRLLCMPQQDPIKYNGNIIIPGQEWEPDGMRCSVLVKADRSWERRVRMTLEGWRASWANPFTDISSAVKSCLLLCSDSRYFNPFNYTFENDTLCGNYAYTDNFDGSNYEWGTFVVGGIFTDFILLEPGLNITFRSCRSSDNKLLWYVENSDEFDQLPYGICYKIENAINKNNNTLENFEDYCRYGYEKFDYGYVKRTFASRSLLQLVDELNSKINLYYTYFDIDIYSTNSDITYDIDSNNQVQGFNWESSVDWIDCNSETNVM